MPKAGLAREDGGESDATDRAGVLTYKLFVTAGENPAVLKKMALFSSQAPLSQQDQRLEINPGSFAAILAKPNVNGILRFTDPIVL